MIRQKKGMLRGFEIPFLCHSKERSDDPDFSGQAKQSTAL